MRTALLLPGQGSQFVGMGRDLADAFPTVAALYEEANDILSVPLSRISWEGPEEELRATQNAQPAILLHSFAVWRLLEEVLAGQVVVAAGHSLGELSAHLVAGTFEYADALRLVRTRGELMARSGNERPGTMAAILGLEEAAVASVCDAVEAGVATLANYNGPGQIVVSGDEAAVTRVMELAAEAGARRVVPLAVSGAFHSPLMEVASEGLAEALDAVELADPAFPVVANATATPATTAVEARETLLRQLTSPVRWADGIVAMRVLEPERWIELGPGRVLGGLLRRIDRSLSATPVGDVESLAAFRTELDT